MSNYAPESKTTAQLGLRGSIVPVARIRSLSVDSADLLVILSNASRVLRAAIALVRSVLSVFRF